MKQGKRWIALMLALAMCLSVLPASSVGPGAETPQVQTTGWVADAGLETMAAPAAVKLSSVKNNPPASLSRSPGKRKAA